MSRLHEIAERLGAIAAELEGEGELEEGRAARSPPRRASSPRRRSRRPTAAPARRPPPSGVAPAAADGAGGPAARLVDAALAELRFATAPRTAGLEEAMRYSLLAGGKRVRPVLALATARALGAPPERFLPVASAIELIHTYSLIHDDLPAMDDDDLRRGKPTSHKRFGEDVAILAGDGLFAEAVRLFCEQPGDPARVLAALRELAAATGVDGMVGGQYVDVVGGRARRRRPARAARAEDRPADLRQRLRGPDPRGHRRK